MNRLILFVLVLFVITSCNLEEDPIAVIELSAPEGFKISYVGSVNFNGELIQLQMVDENIGYILGTRNTNPGNVDVFKTEDGGQSWKDTKVMVSLHPGPGIRGVAESMHFITTDIGVVSYKIGDKMNLLKTTTGGDNWRHHIFEDKVGSIKQISADDEENLYGLLVDEDHNATILKSYDMGLSWNILYAATDFDIYYNDFPFQIFGDKLYVPGPDNDIVVLDTAGYELKRIVTNQPIIRELRIGSENNILANGLSVSLSEDGGENWKEVNENYSRLIGFSSPNEILLIQSNPLNTEPGQVFSATTDGGNTWLESSETYGLTGFIIGNSQKITDNRYLMLIGEEIYEFKEN